MNIFIYIWNGFLKFFGDIKIFRFPFFVLYDPGSYLVKGSEIRKVIDTVKKGDIMIRGYVNYLDGYFIPGYFSHAGLFLGEVKKENVLIPDVLIEKFYEGEQVVMHSMAEGVFMEDVINFCKCDFLVILRRSSEIEQVDFIESSFSKVFENALKCLGKSYDFQFNFSDYHNMSCTEFVFFCSESFRDKYNITMKKRRAIFKKIDMLIPDDLITDKFKIVFQSKSVDRKKLAQIISSNK